MASVKLRQCEYAGGLWYLTGWKELKDHVGRWYVSARLEAGEEVEYVSIDPLEFYQRFLPNLTWVTLIPAPPKPRSYVLSSQARRQAR